MYSQLDLELVRIFGKKDLTEGCIAKWKWQENVTDIIAYRIWDTLWVVTYYEWNWVNVERIDEFSIDEYEVIWHIPHLEDIFRVAKENGKLVEIDSQFNELTLYHINQYGEHETERFFPYDSTLLPTEQPSEETKQALISLFS